MLPAALPVPLPAPPRVLHFLQKLEWTLAKSDKPFHSTTHTNDDRHLIQLWHVKDNDLAQIRSGHTMRLRTASFSRKPICYMLCGTPLMIYLNRSNQKVYLFSLESDIIQMQDKLWKQYGKPIWCRKKNTLKEKKLKTPPEKSVKQNMVWFLSWHKSIELIFFEIIKNGFIPVLIFFRHFQKHWNHLGRKKMEASV